MRLLRSCWPLGVVLVAAGASAQTGPVQPVIPVPPAAVQTPATPSTAPGGTPAAGTTASPVSGPAGTLPTVSSGASKALSDSPTYQIGAEDALQVTVWKEPSFSGPVTVRPDGMISLPLLGDIPAVSKTPTQLGEAIATLLKKYINDPLVTVSVQGVNSKHVFLIGQIARVGPLPLTPDMTPLEAIATAGGPAPFANLKRIYILRPIPGGGEKRIPFDYKKAVKTGDMQGIQLMSGDKIVLP